ncbi:hypothetical protein Ae201684_012676 [Aphanomyces euteiches]|uniref:Uncharacterized protein n=1 Tax=Aphanomyces euteiches TaxID=100861 RepID=A0A6G0WQQ9_9STRA|nr:hypothetical protein Ae201684_012676 [Aphanomyces euteiches]
MSWRTAWFHDQLEETSWCGQSLLQESTPPFLLEASLCPMTSLTTWRSLSCASRRRRSDGKGQSKILE